MNMTESEKLKKPTPVPTEKEQADGPDLQITKKKKITHFPTVADQNNKKKKKKKKYKSKEINVPHCPPM